MRAYTSPVSEFDEWAEANKKIMLIKHVRGVTGMGLKEAKEEVEACFPGASCSNAPISHMWEALKDRLQDTLDGNSDRMAMASHRALAVALHSEFCLLCGGDTGCGFDVYDANPVTLDWLRKAAVVAAGYEEGKKAVLNTSMTTQVAPVFVREGTW